MDVMVIFRAASPIPFFTQTGSLAWLACDVNAGGTAVLSSFNLPRSGRFICEATGPPFEERYSGCRLFPILRSRLSKHVYRLFSIAESSHAGFQGVGPEVELRA